MCETVHIASVSDEKYKRYMLAMIESAMRSAGSKLHIVFHIMGDGFTGETIHIYERFIRGQGHEIEWLRDDLGDIDIPLTMYFTRAATMRLFLADMIDPTIDTIYYLDSDTIIVGDGLLRLVETDIGERALGAVADADVIFKYVTRRTDITDNSYRYFNSGVLIVNLKKWRSEHATLKHMDVLTKYRERLLFVDQDVLNMCWMGDTYYLPLKFNVSSANYAFRPWFLARGCGAPYYAVSEIKDATAHPYILHFYGYASNRPWKRVCYHPMKRYYIEAARDTPYGFVLEDTSVGDVIRYTRRFLLRELEPLVTRAFFFTLGDIRRKILRRLGNR